MSRHQARALADVSAGLILAEIEIAASPEKVFTALTSQEVLSWWGDDGTYRTTGWEADLRVGGRWKATGTGADGQAFCVEGGYLAIDAPWRIVQTWEPDWDGGQVTTLTYSLSATGLGTHVTVRHEGFKPVQEASCRSHAAGWEMVLTWLRAYLAPPADSPAPLRYLLRLLPPRPSFATDMTQQEREAMASHKSYWSEQMKAGRVILFGPVLDPAGLWGLLVLEVHGEQEMHSLKDADPALSGIPGMRWEVLPFLQSQARPHIA